MRTWVNGEFSKADASTVKMYLKTKGIKYEPSQVGDMIHIEAYMTANELTEFNNWVDDTLE